MYIGETGRRLSEHIKEHGDIRGHSHVAQHALKTNHKLLPDFFLASYKIKGIFNTALIYASYANALHITEMRCFSTLIY